MGKILQCKQCSGTELHRINMYEYKCNYCGSITLLERSNNNNPIKSLLKNKKAYYIITGIILFSIIFISRFFINISPPPKTKKSYTTNSIKIEKDDPTIKAKLKIIEHKLIINKSSKYSYILAMLQNTGTTRSSQIRIEAHLYLKNKKISVESGYGIRRYLDPKEKTPIRIIFNTNTKFDDYKLILHPKKASTYIRTRPLIKISDIQFKKKKYYGMKGIGHIQNLENKTIQYISIRVALFNTQNKLYYIGNGHITQKIILKKEVVPFKFTLYGLKQKPHKYLLDYNALFVEK